VVGFETGT